MLTGPELDLLIEVLDEDPTADCYLDVARTLVDRGDARDAARVLRRALQHGADDPEAARLLARAASDSGDHAGVKAAGEVLGEDVMRADPVLARAWALALDQAGDLERAGDLAARLLEQHGEDPDLRAVVERQHAAPPDPGIRGLDPLCTVSRAEAYLENGRPDLAIGTYRRILARHPADPAVHARLLRLNAMPREPRPWVDDLSEEYWVQRAAPAALAVPAPRLVPQRPPEPDDQATQPGAPPRVALAPSAAAEADDEETDVRPRLSPIPTPTPTPPPPPPRPDDEATVVAPGTGLPAEYDIFSDDADADDADEETTVMRLGDDGPLGPPSRDTSSEAPTVPAAPERRSLPGLDDLRAALDEERDDLDDLDADAVSDLEDDEDLPTGADGEIDPDAVIEQAKAIERRAARRRSLLQD